MNALSELHNFPLTKAQQDDFAAQAIEEILSGNTDPVRVDIRLKAMAEVIDCIRKNKQVQEYTLAEMEKWGKRFVRDGVTIEVKTRTTRDFTGIDPVLDDLYADLDRIKAHIKAREATVLAGVDPATGETFAPPATSTTTFPTYKF